MRAIMPIASIDMISSNTLRQSTVPGLRLIAHRPGVNLMYQIRLQTQIRNVFFIMENVHGVDLKMAPTDLA
jgi:hypothetical protein